MPFANPVMAGRYLVRQVMQSAGYVAGKAGWQIAKDGTAQFNNVTILGTFSTQTAQGNVLQLANGEIVFTDSSGNILDLIELGSDFIAFYVGDGTPGQYANVLTLDTSQVQVTGSLTVTGTASYSPGTRTGLGSLGASGLDITVSTFETLADGKVFFSIKGTATAAVSSGSKTFPVSLPAALQPATPTELPVTTGGTLSSGDNWPRLYIQGSAVTLYWPSMSSGLHLSCQAVMDLQ
ncbi:MAG: hypothetical protein ACYCVZ_18020 [Streptosporangiaceae bacterium]